MVEVQEYEGGSDDLADAPGIQAHVAQRLERHLQQGVAAFADGAYAVMGLRGLHLTGAAQVSALPPESAWQVLDPGLTCGFCSVDRRSTPVKWRPLMGLIELLL
jgi:hypothetical protein